MGLKIAIIDAAGILGHEILNVFAESETSIEAIYALTTRRQSGKDLSFGDIDIKTTDMDMFDYASVDVVFVAGYPREAKSIIQKAVSAGITVIDCLGVSLFDDIKGKVRVLPHVTALQLITALKPLQDHVSIKRIVVTTFESTSGAGKDGMDELFNQARKFFVSDGLENNVFPKQITFNVIPQIDGFMDDGQTEAEWTLSSHTKKLLGKDIKVTASCVQVPVFIGHSMCVNVEFNGDIDAKTARQLWREAEDTIVIIDESSEIETVSPAEIAGDNQLYISRVREDATVDNGLNFWCVADNIRLVALKSVELMNADS